jgi:hypothetical protein
MMLVLDRTMLNNKYTFSAFRDLFNQIAAPEKVMTKPKFFYAVQQLAKILFPTEKTPIETIFNTLLIERNTNTKDIDQPKVPQTDEVNKRLLTEGCINVLCDYEKELQRTYCIYNADNVKYGKMMLNWKEISVQNKKLNTLNFVRMLKEADVIPNIISIEQFAEMMSKIVPPIAFKEHGFYNNNIPTQIYEKDIPNNVESKYEGDPQFLFHEFQLVLARIAAEALGRHSEKKEDEKNIKQFFAQNLLIRDNEELTEKELPQINRPFLKRLILSYQPELKAKRLQMQEEGKASIEADMGLIDNGDPILDAAPMAIDFNDVFKRLDKDLPPLPEPYQVKQENPPQTGGVFKPDKVTIGVPMPKPPPDKNANKKAAPKPKAKKKGDKEEKPIKWAGFPPPDPVTSQQVVAEYDEELEDEEESEELASGLMSDIEVAPTIIRETLYPVNMPPSIVMLIEAAMITHNTSNFASALGNLEKAKAEWIKQQEGEELGTESNIYFEFSKGLLYESANRDDFAFNSFYLCKQMGDGLLESNPNKALSYCGMGAILYKTHDYVWALRCFFRARDIREATIGLDSVDTASVYNNIACCLYMIDRTNESYSFFELSQAILEAGLGPFHYRTGTALRNLQKCKKHAFKTKAPYKMPWQAFVLDRFPKKKKGKKKKKKG